MITASPLKTGVQATCETSRKIQTILSAQHIIGSL